VKQNDYKVKMLTSENKKKQASLTFRDLGNKHSIAREALI